MKRKKLSQAGMLIIGALEELQKLGADYDKPWAEQPPHIRAVWATLSPALDELIQHLNKDERKRYDALVAQLKRNKSGDQSFPA